MDVNSISSLSTELSSANVSNSYQAKLFKGANEQQEKVTTELVQDAGKSAQDPDKGQNFDTEA